MKLEIRSPNEASIALKAVALCASNDNARPALTTVRIRPCATGVEIAACDSYVMAMDVITATTVHGSGDCDEVLLSVEHAKAIAKILATKYLQFAIVDITVENVTVAAFDLVSTFPTMTDHEYPDLGQLREQQEKDHAEADSSMTEITFGSALLGTFCTIAKMHKMAMTMDLPSTALKPAGIRLEGRPTFYGLIMPRRA